MTDDISPNCRVAIAVIAFEAEARIAHLLDRIPPTIAGARPLLLVANDASSDGTQDAIDAWEAEHPEAHALTIHRPRNLGYGGNQIATYTWASELGAQVVVLLHGDGQYPPEMIESLIAPILAGNADAVFGSRMSVPGAARSGGMPLRRYVGNRALTRILNLLTGADLTEWFSGFRAYSLVALDSVDLNSLPHGFDIDAAITIRLLDQGSRIREVPIPTRYTDEISRVPLFKTGLAALDVGFRHAWRRVTRSAGRAPDKLTN